MSTKTPASVSVRMYNVGFGDCFLITFHYAESGAAPSHAHLLVDFGSSERPPNGPEIDAIAQAITDDTGQRGPDIVVATHRHQDHISGFARSDRLRTWQPTLVIRPWPDAPDADEHTTGPMGRMLQAQLASFDQFAEDLSAFKAFGRSGDRHDVLELAEQLIPNRKAIAQLEAWAAAASGCRYVAAGDTLDLGDVALGAPAPGVTIDILGPPTLDQVPGLTHETTRSDEFWASSQPFGQILSQAASADPAQLRAVYRQLAPPRGRGDERWLLRRLSTSQVSDLLGIMRSFDDALNNTSIIMLVTAGDRSILLTGDAQIENWSHSLGLARQPGNGLGQRLADLDLYKVGHHGSRNATPRSLFRLWDGDGLRRKPPKSLLTMMSTLPGKHGRQHPVPKDNLVAALERISRLARTDTLSEGSTSVCFTASCTGAATFEEGP